MNKTICQGSAHSNFFKSGKSIFTHVLSRIVGDSYRKVNEEQDSMAEEYLKNNIILDSGSSIDIFYQSPVSHGYQEDQPSSSCIY